MNYLSKSKEVNFAFVTERILYMEHRNVWCCNMDTQEIRSEVSLKFRNVVWEEDGEGQLNRSCEKRRSITKSQGRNKHPTYNKKEE